MCESGVKPSEVEDKAGKGQFDDIEASVKALLPFWPRLYSKLASDSDRRVREAAQKAHLASKPKLLYLYFDMIFFRNIISGILMILYFGKIILFDKKILYVVI